jgi:hypothetical protein
VICGAESRRAQERWAAYLAAHTVPAWCSRCAAEIVVWPWEDLRSCLCLDCARQELAAEDAAAGVDAPIQQALPLEVLTDRAQAREEGTDG